MKRYAILALLVAAGALYAQDSDEALNEFVIAFVGDSHELNPIYSITSTEAQIYQGVYEGLVSYAPRTLEPEPAIAERWEISDDGLTYTFYLRRNARYSNGDRVTAQHFRDTWLRTIAPETDSAYNFLFDVIDGVREYRNSDDPDPSRVGIQAVNNTTLRVHLRNPASHFIRVLAHHSFVAVHPSLLDVRDWSRVDSIPVNGPYQFVSREEDQWIIERNPRYWDRDNVGIDRIRFLFTDAEVDEVTERFNRGFIDWVTGGMTLGDVQFEDTIVINPLFATTYYFIRSDREPFSDPDVRRALALLLPWSEIRDPEILFTPASTLVPSIPRYPTVVGLTAQDRDEAMALLAGAGFPQGRGLPEIIVHIPDGLETARVAAIMKESWESALDVQVTVLSTVYNDYFDALDRSRFTVGTVSWIGDFADPLTFLQMWISESNINDAGYANPEYDELVDRAMAETSNERFEIMAEAEAMLLQSGTVLPVSHIPSVNLIDRDAVDGWHPNPLDMHPLKVLQFSGTEPIPGVINYWHTPVPQQ